MGAGQIVKNLGEDDLRPEDIIVINPDPKSTAKQVGPIMKILFDKHQFSPRGCGYVGRYILQARRRSLSRHSLVYFEPRVMRQEWYML